MMSYLQNCTFRLLRGVLLLAGLMGAGAMLHAQTLTGKVSDAASGNALPGANVVVKGTTTGAITNDAGEYSLRLPAGADSLTVSFLGYTRQTVAIGSRTTINFSLAEEVSELDDVVITALGVARSEKALGYAVQEVDGEQLIKARETNLVNALAGKVAGVTVVGMPSGVGASARITIRGEKSININSNQPLFVIDGVPILNDVVGSAGRSRQEADYGNTAAMVNPDDIESITVLKGANAAALYGSRANNGVILITTKSGKGTKGIGVSVNSTTSFETPLLLPEYQNVYGQGLNGEFSFTDGNGGGLRDGVDESWGPKMEGQLIPQHNSPRSNPAYRGGDIASPGAQGTTVTATPFSPQPDNVANFFETGRTLTNNVAVAGSNDNGSFRLSYTNLDQKGFVPNTDLRRNTVALSGGYKLGKKLTVNAVVNYIQSASDNRPNNSYGTENIMYLFNCWLGRHVNLEDHKEYWQRDLEGLRQYNFNYNYHDNPYFNLFENTNALAGDRVFGNVIVKYEFTSWLNLQLRTATDFNNEVRSRRRAFSTQRFPFGSYGEERVKQEERNTDFLLNFNKEFGQITVSASAGGNRRDRKDNYLELFAPQLLIPGLYTFSNSRVELQSSYFRSDKRVNSLYGFAQIGFRNSIFLDVTARNDWSSTLPVANNSYFYPSASLSVVLSDLVKLPDFVSFVKLRGSYAQVGNDTDPYALTQVYNAGTPFGADRVFSESASLVNADLKPEISRSSEIGVDMRFFKGRLGLDFTFYNINSTNQIIPIPLSSTTGYSTKLINAGEIRNWGYEAMLSVVPVKTKAFNWDINFNFSANRSEVISLTEDIQSYRMADRYVTVEARVGDRMGSVYGIGYKRVTDESSPFFGEVIVDKATGRPTATTDRILLGNYNPDWLLGIYNTFDFKGISLGVLFDIRQGGVVYSHTQTVGREGGMIIETLEGRADGYDLTKPGNGVFFPGVFQNPDGSYTQNEEGAGGRELSAREYHTAITLGRRIIEGMMYDASFTKLREVRLGYTLPNSIFGNSNLRNVTISAVGRNLFVWSKVPHVDPETASLSGGTFIPGVESVAIPSARSFGFNVSFNL